jgi:hypothetical protein
LPGAVPAGTSTPAATVGADVTRARIGLLVGRSAESVAAPDTAVAVRSGDPDPISAGVGDAVLASDAAGEGAPVVAVLIAVTLDVGDADERG